MSTETPKQVLRTVLTALDQSDWSIFDTHPGLYETRHHLPHLHAAFPDMHHTIETELAEGNLVACVSTVHGTHLGPFMGIAPTGKQVSFMVLWVDRIVDGIIVDHWGLPDFLSLFRQVGVSMSPTAPQTVQSPDL
jgi:predicted ester cyclase